MLDDGLVTRPASAPASRGLPHNLARAHFEGHILNTLTEHARRTHRHRPVRRHATCWAPSDIAQIRDELAENPEVRAAIDELWPRLTPQRLRRGLPRRARRYLPDEDAAAIRRPVTRAWTVADVPLLDEAAELLGVDDRVRAGRGRSASGRTQVAVRAGRAGRLVRLADLRVRGQGRGGLRGPVRARHHRRRAVRRAPGGGRPPQRRRARGGRPHLGVRAHHRRRGAGAVADGLAAADAAQPDPLDDPGRRPGADRGGGGRRLLGADPRSRTSRTAGSTPGSASTTARPPRSWSVAAAVVRRRAPRLRAAEFGAVHRGPAVGARRPTICAGAVAKAVAELTPAEGRLAVIAPRDLHRRLAARLDGVTAGAEPDLTRTVVLLDPRQAKGLEFDSVLVVEPGRYGDERPVRGADPGHAAVGGAAQSGVACGAGGRFRRDRGPAGADPGCRQRRRGWTPAPRCGPMYWTYLGLCPVRRVAPATPLRQWASVPGVATGRTWLSGH